MRTYIAGPMRNYPQFNFPAFFGAEDRLRAAGHDPINPARMDIETGFDPDTSAVDEAFLRDAMERDMVAICQCDGIALLDGWQASSGVTVELALARFLGLEVRTLAEWLPQRDVQPTG